MDATRNNSELSAYIKLQGFFKEMIICAWSQAPLAISEVTRNKLATATKNLQDFYEDEFYKPVLAVAERFACIGGNASLCLEAKVSRFSKNSCADSVSCEKLSDANEGTPSHLSSKSDCLMENGIKWKNLRRFCVWILFFEFCHLYLGVIMVKNGKVSGLW